MTEARNMTQYAHYRRYGITEPYVHQTFSGPVWIARCKCGWESRWRFQDKADAEVDAEEHMLQADVA